MCVKFSNNGFSWKVECTPPATEANIPDLRELRIDAAKFDEDLSY